MWTPIFHLTEKFQPSQQIIIEFSTNGTHKLFSSFEQIFNNCGKPLSFHTIFFALAKYTTHIFDMFNIWYPIFRTCIKLFSHTNFPSINNFRWKFWLVFWFLFLNEKKRQNGIRLVFETRKFIERCSSITNNRPRSKYHKIFPSNVFKKETSV